MSGPHLEAEVLVVGSGAGGAPTAAVLAEAGFDVLVLEEGPDVRQGDVVPFSLKQMDRQYRAGGVTAAIGFPSIAYTEGCCVGGSTEVNSGLYRRPPEDVLARWRRAHAISGLSTDELYAICDEVEHDLAVQPVPGAQIGGSEAMRRGAAALGWRHEEIPRWMTYEDGPDARHGRRRSMSETYLPRAVAAGARVVAGHRVDRLVLDGGRARRALLTTADGEPGTVDAAHVIVCGGAIQTPALLQRSGLRHQIGRTLAVHPTVKLAARFPRRTQRRRRRPRLPGQGVRPRPLLRRLGVRSGPRRARPQRRLGPRRRRHRGVAPARRLLRGHHERGPRHRARPARPTRPARHVPPDAARPRRDAARLARLALLMLEAGATVVHPSYRGAPVVRSRADLATIEATFTVSRASVMTVHLCSTAPLGEDAGSATDSFGLVRGTANVHVNDASLLPDAPGVNPQGSVMAFAIRNARHFVETTERAH